MNAYVFSETPDSIGRGDIIYSLAISKLLGDGDYIFNNNRNHLGSDYVLDVQKLLLEQPHVKGVYKNIQIVHNKYTKIYEFGNFWRQPDLTNIQIPKNMAASVGVSNFKMYWEYINLTQPIRKISHDYILFSRTSRYNDSNLNWSYIIDMVSTYKSENLYFIGLEYEYKMFISKYKIANDTIKFLNTSDLYEVAEYIYYASEIYTNQTATLTIAQGLNKKYNLEVATSGVNCIYESPNENLLNCLPSNYKRHYNGVVEQINKFNYNYNNDYITKNYTKINDLTLKMGELRYKYLVDNIGDISNKKVLEIGYGDGSFLKAIVDKCNPFGYDITGLPVPTGVTQESNIVNSKYDVICMFDVLEHYHNITDIAQYKPEYFYLSVPNCKFLSNTWFINWKHRKPNEHVFHFNKYSLTMFMESIGYVPVCHSYIEDEIRKGIEPDNILSMIFKKK